MLEAEQPPSGLPTHPLSEEKGQMRQEPLVPMFERLLDRLNARLLITLANLSLVSLLLTAFA